MDHHNTHRDGFPRHLGRGPSALEDDVYDVLLAMLAGISSVPSSRSEHAKSTTRD